MASVKLLIAFFDNSLSSTSSIKSQRSAEGIILIIALSWGSRSGVKAPSCHQRFGHLTGLAELEVAGLLGYNGALMNRFELGNKLGFKFADLLGVEVTHLLRDIHQRGNGLVMALFRSLFISTSSSADLNRQLLTGGVSNKLAGLLLNILGGTGGLIHGPTLLRSLAVAHLLHRPVALLHSLIEGLLLEGDLTGLLKVLLTHLLLSRGELRDIGVVALLHILVGALKDGILLKRSNFLQFIYTAEVSGWISDTVTEVHSTRYSTIVLTSSTG